MPESKRKSKKAETANLETLGLEMGNKPPQALDFERAVLGAMLVEPNCVDDVLDELPEASSFYDPKNRIIYQAIKSLHNNHDVVDMLSVTQALRAKGELEEVGGPAAIALLTEQVASAANVEFYIRIVKQKSIQRDLITASLSILKNAYDDSVNVDELIDQAQTDIYNAVDNNIKRDVQDIGSVIREALDNIEQMQGQEGLSGVPSGYPTLDKMTMGWQPSDLIILAARPSVGKTAFALNIARNAAVDHNMPVAFFSLEMPVIQLAKRLMTTETELPADKIKGGKKLSAAEWDQLNNKIARLSKAPIYVDDTPGLPVTEFRSKVKRLVKQKGVRLVIVDYLQLMQAPSAGAGMREQEVAAVSRMLKATAKEQNVPIIALSQLSRQSVNRQGSNGRPQLSDLRESGSIEQDADMVLFVHRPDYVGLSENGGDKEITQLIIAKHRNGEIGDIDMRFLSDKVRFVEVDSANPFLGESMGGFPSGQTYSSAMNDDSYSPFDDSGFSGGGFSGGGFGTNSFE